MKKDTGTCSLVFLDSTFQLTFALINTNQKTTFWSFLFPHGSYNHLSSTLTKRFSNISGKVEVHSLFLRSASASCLLWETVHFSWSKKYHYATALCIHKLYNTFLRCSTKLHIKHIHKHYTYKTPNPTAIMSSYVPTPAFFLILHSYHQHHTVWGTVQVHDIKGCLETFLSIVLTSVQKL